MTNPKETWNDQIQNSRDLSAKGQDQKRDVHRQSGSNVNGEREDLVLYPAYCFKASLVWFTWVKLTAYDVHYTLQERKGFYAISDHGFSRDLPLLLFFLNHPIQFVQIVGVVVEVDEFNEKFWLFTIDDSSGATIGVTCRKVDSKPVQNSITNSGETKEDKEKLASLKTLHDLITAKVSIGTVVQVKGTINTFRNIRQIVLERLFIIPTTTQEVTWTRSRVQYRKEVLNKPWLVSEADQRKLQKEALGEADETRQRQVRARERARRREEREARDAKRIQKEYETEEKERQLQAEKARNNGKLLLVTNAAMDGKTKFDEVKTNSSQVNVEKARAVANEVREQIEQVSNGIIIEDERTKLLRLLRKS